MDLQSIDHGVVGTEVYRYLGVAVISNGLEKDLSHGQHFNAESNYYYGQKWQCVEFVKRFYEQVLNHRMPHVWGHAKDYFDERVEHGGWNSRRGLAQYRNRANDCPRVHDILVFSDTEYGHLAIVTSVSEKSVEVVQQNIAGKPLERYELARSTGKFFVYAPRIPLGWLRKEGP